MIGKILKRSDNFRARLNYALKDGKDPEIVGGNMAGRDAGELAEEFMHTRRLNSKVARPVMHIALSLAPGERLDSAQWSIATREYVRDLGLEDHQWVAIRHEDGGQDHVHLILDAIGPDGKVWKNFGERARSAKACRRAEKAFGLQSGARLETRRSGIRYTKAEREMHRRTGKWPPRVIMARQIEKALRSNPPLESLKDFQIRLMVDHEIILTAHFDRESGDIRGLSYSRGDAHFSARQLSGRATLPAIKELLNDAGKGPMSQAAVLIGSEPAGKQRSSPVTSILGDCDDVSSSHDSLSSLDADGSILVSKDLDKWTFRRLTELNRKRREAAFQMLVASVPPAASPPRRSGNSSAFQTETPTPPVPAKEERVYDMTSATSSVSELDI